MAADEGEAHVQNAELRKELERFVVENDDLLTLESRIGRFNIFDALRITNVEIRHSNFLAFLLDPAESHGQGQLFLKAILMDLLTKAPLESRPLSPIALDGADLRGVEIKREWKHTDIVIKCKEPQIVVVIENKIGAKEGQDQLSRYRASMEKHYPGALYVYLTRDSDEPSDDAWMPYSYEHVHGVLDRVRKMYGKAIGDEVLVFLDHYLNLIGTRFMDNEELDKLCQRIYKTHRQALDLIWSRVGTPTTGVLAEVKEVLDGDPRWHMVPCSSNQVNFVPAAWLDWLPKLGLKSDPRLWIIVQVWASDGRLAYAVCVGRMKDVENRKEIVTKLIANRTEFGFKLGKAKKISDNWSVIAPAESISVWGEDDAPEKETIQADVKKMLDDLYPKLEKLAKVLKPLCK